jgi:ADP-heptose:LPS heptosyltransferase
MKCDLQPFRQEFLKCSVCKRLIHESFKNLEHSCNDGTVMTPKPPSRAKAILLPGGCCGGKKTVVYDANPHGIGDLACVLSIRETVKGRAIGLEISTTDAQKKMVAEMFGAPVYTGIAKSRMMNTFQSYEYELRAPQTPRVISRARGLGFDLSLSQIKNPTVNMSDEHREWAKQFHEPEKKLVLIAPCSIYSNREWPMMHWNALGTLLAALGYQVRFITHQPDARFPDALHGLSWRQVAALMMESALVCGPDSGPCWISALCRVPTLAVMGPTPPTIFAHLPDLQAVSGTKHCTGCFYKGPNYLPQCHTACASLNELPIETVLDKALTKLGAP